MPSCVAAVSTGGKNRSTCQDTISATSDRLMLGARGTACLVSAVPEPPQEPSKHFVLPADERPVATLNPGPCKAARPDDGDLPTHGTRDVTSGLGREQT